MRQIKFRGLRRDGLGWAYGYICPDKDGDMNIITEQPWEPIFRFKVHPKTVGQFTGLTDKNGKEIWEGDIMKFDQHDQYYIVYFEDGSFVLSRGISHEVNRWGLLSLGLEEYFCRELGGLTVTGNIHEQ